MSKNNEFEKIKKLLTELFEEAKTTNEFEYCLALLRIKGLQSMGWDTLQESHTLLTQALSLVNANAPIENGFRMRLLLMSYCHATEMSFTYNMVANMIQISNGEEYHTDWFHDEKNQIIYPTKKIESIEKFASKNNQKEIAKMLKGVLFKDIRNAFNHADYILYKDELRIYDPKRKIGELRVTTKIYKLNEIIPQLARAINIVLILMDVTRSQVLSYKKNKRVPSKLLEDDPYFEMELQTHPKHGLIGAKGVPKK